jgi:trigger factor
VSSQELDPNAQSFENEQLKVIVSHKPHCMVKFDITVSSEAVEASYRKAQKNVTKEISVPGFRKGRAPDHLIKDRFTDVIQKEFVDIVLQTAFNEAVQLTHIYPLRDGQMKRPVVHECSREKGAHFILEFEAKPLVPSVKLEDLQITKVITPPITDKERANALEQVLMQLTTYEPVEGRAVEAEDFIDLNLTTLEETPREVINNQRTQVNSSSVPQWVRSKLIGLQAGESAETLTEYEGSNEEERVSFQAIPVRLTVSAIYKGNIPPIDDELAKKVGLQTVEELHQKINERLEQEAQHQAHQQEMQQLEEALLAQYSFDLPQTYIENDKQARLATYIEQREAREQEPVNQQNYKQIEQMIEQITVRQLQLFFLLHKAAADHQIELTDTEVSQELMHQVNLMQSGRAEIDIASSKDKLREQLEQIALYRKIKNFLIENSQQIS